MTTSWFVTLSFLSRFYWTEGILYLIITYQSSKYFSRRFKCNQSSFFSFLFKFVWENHFRTSNINGFFTVVTLKKICGKVEIQRIKFRFFWKIKFSHSQLKTTLDLQSTIGWIGEFTMTWTSFFLYQISPEFEKRKNAVLFSGSMIKTHGTEAYQLFSPDALS